MAHTFQRLRQLSLCLVPLTPGSEHGCVVHATEGKLCLEAVAAAELHVAVAPLAGAVDVPDLLARNHHDAQRRGDAVEALHLSRESRRGRLIETAHAVGYLAQAHQGQPLGSQASHLKSRHAQTAGELSRLNGELSHALHVAVHVERELGLHQRQPDLLRPGGEAVEEPVGPL
jgi:hypothetical protein